MGHRFRKYCLDSYAIRRERSPNLIYDGGQSGNLYNPNSIFSPFYAPVLMTENWTSSPAGTDAVVGMDANSAFWLPAQVSYVTGVATNIQYDGLGNQVCQIGAGPPVLRGYTQNVVFNFDKPHWVQAENMGTPLVSGVQQASISWGVEVANSPSLPKIGFALNGGTDAPHATANIQVLTPGGVVTIATGSAFFRAAGGVLRTSVSAWNGTSRSIQTMFNGVVIDTRSTTVRGLASDTRLRFILGSAQVAGGPPNAFCGTLKFGGFTT